MMDPEQPCYYDCRFNYGLEIRGILERNGNALELCTENNICYY